MEQDTKKVVDAEVVEETEVVEEVKEEVSPMVGKEISL